MKELKLDQLKTLAGGGGPCGKDKGGSSAPDCGGKSKSGKCS